MRLMSPRNLLNKYPILKSFIEKLKARSIKGVSRVIVFGSAVAGTASDMSDIDIIVLSKFEDISIKEAVREVAYKAMEEDGFLRLISLHFMEESRFAMLFRAGYAFEVGIESEGVPLWQAA